MGPFNGDNQLQFDEKNNKNYTKNDKNSKKTKKLIENE